MIFVTVGTHEQPFDRLLKAMDKLVETGIIQEETVIQAGFSTYQPAHCRSFVFCGYREMQAYVRQARIVITHGGPSSFMMPLSLGKVPVVVPRLHRFGEHVNDHQRSYCREIEKLQNSIIVVTEMEQLASVLENYDRLAAARSASVSSNREEFVRRFGQMVTKLMETK